MNILTISPWEASQFASTLGAQALRLSRNIVGDWTEFAALCTDATFARDRASRLDVARMAAKRCRSFAALGGAFGRSLSAHYRALALVLFAAARWQSVNP